MKQRDLIKLQERQIEVLNGTISDLRSIIKSLREEVSSLKEALLAKGGNRERRSVSGNTVSSTFISRGSVVE